LTLLLDYLEAAGVIGREGGEIRAATTPGGHDGTNRSESGGRADQLHSVTLTLTVSHPNGNIVKFDAIFPLATWQAGLGPYFDGIREAVARNFPTCDVERRRPGTPDKMAQEPQAAPMRPRPAWDHNRWLFTDEAVSVLGMSVRSLQYFANDGKVQTQAGPGALVLYNRDDLERLARMRRECRNSNTKIRRRTIRREPPEPPV
jgi:hypothetical protein